LKDLKDGQKARKKTLKAELRAIEKAIPDAEYELKVLTTRGKIELILADPELVGTLKERWIGAEVAKRLDYPIFMAVSERGGKNNSGNYEYMIDDQGSLVEFPDGHPQEGQLVIDQDLVNFDLGPDDLKDASALPPEAMAIAEAFVKLAQEQGLSFWEVG
jgi:type I restriction enzyme M protein